MTFRQHLTRCLAHNLLLALVLACLAMTLQANAPTVRQGRRRGEVEGSVECWNPHTAQITTEVGECPVPVNPYVATR